MSLSDDDIRILFDTAISSLDFGSGFLDNKEVEALRRVAVHLDVDPRTATPHNFMATYYPKDRPGQTPQKIAASLGHIGVAYKMSDRVTRIERYTCACGWSGRYGEFEEHLLAVAAAP